VSRRTVRTPEKAFERFLQVLGEGATVAEACRAAGMSRSTAYDRRDRDEQFRHAWADAVEAGTEALEAEARRRAMEGSDTLMIFLLKARRPEIYRERQEVRHTGQQRPMSAQDLGRIRDPRSFTDEEHLLLEKVAAMLADSE
jgi:hypothetical protein